MESGQAPIPADFSALSNTATAAACQSSNPLTGLTTADRNGLGESP